MTDHPAIDYICNRTMADRRLAVQRDADRQFLAYQRRGLEMSDNAARAAPLFYAVMVIAALAVGVGLTNDHMKDKYAGSAQSAQILADCLNGKHIVADGLTFYCVAANRYMK